jgi:putative DNA primase/helicase
MTAADIASALYGRRSGSSWVACCPAHEDHNPSLSIRDQDGHVLVHCHAGCEQTAVIDALRGRGLWQEQEQHSNRRIIAEYDYRSESGELLYQVVRFEPKGFAQRYPNGAGGWTWKKHQNQVLYHLPEVIEAPIVFVVEGERDVETLREYGFVATTNAGGAKAPWLDSYTEMLRGRECIIVPDNDAPGWEHAKRVARALLGQATEVIILNDIHRDGVKDITDWFRAGHSECELISLVESVYAG